MTFIAGGTYRSGECRGKAAGTMTDVHMERGQTRRHRRDASCSLWIALTDWQRSGSELRWRGCRSVSRGGGPVDDGWMVGSIYSGGPVPEAAAAREGAGCDGGLSWNASANAGGKNLIAAIHPPFGVLGDPVAVGAVFQENDLEFLPESFNRENAETEADLGEDLADRMVAEQGRDFLGCREGGEDGVSLFLGRGAGRARGLRSACAARAGRAGGGGSLGSAAWSAAARRRARVMRASIRAMSLVPKRTLIQRTAMAPGRWGRLSTWASSLPWVMSLPRTRRRRVVRAGELAAASSWWGSGLWAGAAVCARRSRAAKEHDVSINVKVFFHSHS